MPNVYLVYGGQTGWIGQMLVALLQQRGDQVVVGQARLEDRTAVAQELREAAPKAVICSAGLTGRPNVDWCESHQREVIRTNMVGTLQLADLCDQAEVPLTLLGTGCVYSYSPTHPLGSGKGYTEEDTPNFHGSFYSHTKAMIDDLIRYYPRCLYLRIRMPISDDLHPRNFITKITRYERVVDIPNSMTVLDDALPLALAMTRRGATGVYNLTNPGVVSHNEILSLYQEHIDPTFTWRNFTEEEQNQVLKARRSNNELDGGKLARWCEEAGERMLPEIHASLVGVFERMAKARQ